MGILFETQMTASKKHHPIQKTKEQLLNAQLKSLPIYRRVHKQAAFCVEWSSRLKRNLAITYPVKNIIRVTTDLAVSENQYLLPEVLTHEIAHLEAFRLIQTKEGPHGQTWQKIMASEGYKPRKSLMLTTSTETRRADERKVYLHTCTDCGYTRVAKRPVSSWRCITCLDAGLTGHLSIERR